MSVRALIPASVASSEAVQLLGDVVDAELVRLAGDAVTPNVLGRLDEVDRASLDDVARYLGVDLYDPHASDDVVRELIRGAFAWHRRRGTPWSLRWALDALGLGHAEVLEPADIAAQPLGYDVFDGTPPWHFDEADGNGEPARRLARWALDSDLPQGLGWAEFVVRLDLDADPTGEAWGPQLARAVELSAPASRHAHFVLAFGDPSEWRAEGALLEARRALGDGYEYSYLPTWSGVPLDGSWALLPSAVHARPVRPAGGEGGAGGGARGPAPATLPLAPRSPAAYAATDHGDGAATLTGPVEVETYEVVFDGVPYTRRRALLADYTAASALTRTGPALYVPAPSD